MKLGYIGLGKMGKNMVENMLEHDHQVVVWNRSPEPAALVAAKGAIVAESVPDLVEKLEDKKIVWLMLPAGEVTNNMIQQLVDLMNPGDIIIDGANSFFRDTQKNYEICAQKGVEFIDIGVSGGPKGAREGACLMVGGKEELYQQLLPLLKDIAAPEAVAHFRGNGYGHLVKMVHNGIEYGMMQAIGEGFEVLRKFDKNLDLTEVARIYGQQSVISSRLVNWLHQAYLEHGLDLAQISGEVAASGEGQWTADTAKELGVPTPVIQSALDFRTNSQGNPSYTGQVVSALRNQFGGHSVEVK